MREILFRGKSVLNGEWLFGNILKTDDGVFVIQNFDPFGGLAKYEVDNNSVCQYTGLTDKNGRKIFEGDVIRLPNCEDDIAFIALKGCNYFLKGNHSDYVIGSYEGKYFDVIGNIFDNPDLIGEQP